MDKNRILTYQKLIDFMILFAYLGFLDIKLFSNPSFFLYF